MHVATLYIYTNYRQRKEIQDKETDYMGVILMHFLFAGSIYFAYRKVIFTASHLAL